MPDYQKIYRRRDVRAHFGGISNYTLDKLIADGILSDGRKFSGGSQLYWTANDLRRADRRLEEINRPKPLPPSANRTKGLSEKQKQQARMSPQF